MARSLRRLGSGPSAPRVSVIIPAHDAVGTVGACIAALSGSLSEAGAPWELLLVDDGSLDGTADAARRAIDGLSGPVRAELITLAHNRGAAWARNEGAARAFGAVLLFVDADVRTEGTGAVLSPVLAGEVACAYAPPSPAPEHRGLLTVYENAFMHVAITSGRKREALPYTALCAIDRAAFLSIGGFDGTLAGAGMEDIELGWRLRDRGISTIRVDGARAVDLGRTTARGLFGKFFSTGRTWMRAFRRRRAPASSLPSHAVSGYFPAALALAAALLALALAAIAGLAPPALALAAAALLVLWSLPLALLVARSGGGVGALLVPPLLALHSLAYLAGLAAGLVGSDQ